MRHETQHRTCAAVSVKNKWWRPASPSTSSDVPSSVSCVCVTFLLTGGSCRSLLCRSVCYLGTRGGLFRPVVFSGHSLPLRAECVLVYIHEELRSYDYISLLVVRVDLGSPVTRSRECLAMPSRGPCCSPLDPWVSLLRGPSVFDRLPGPSFYRREVRVSERRVAHVCCTEENTC